MHMGEAAHAKHLKEAFKNAQCLFVLSVGRGAHTRLTTPDIYR